MGKSVGSSLKGKAFGVLVIVIKRVTALGEEGGFEEGKEVLVNIAKVF